MNSLNQSQSFTSFSFCNSSSMSSLDSEALCKIQAKTSEITSLINQRLEKFLKVSNKCIENESIFSASHLEDLHASLNQTLIQGVDNLEDELFIKQTLEEISSLYKQLVSLNNKLEAAKSSIRETEEEELELKNQACKVESHLNKLILESNETRAYCKCLLM